MSIALNKFNSFVGALGQKKVDLSADALKVVLTDTAPIASNSVLTDIAQIAAGGGYVAGGITVSGQTWTGATGTWTLKIPVSSFTATGVVAQFRYMVLYSATATNEDLIGWYDRGAETNMASGDVLNLNFDQANGVFTLG